MTLLSVHVHAVFVFLFSTCCLFLSFFFQSQNDGAYLLAVDESNDHTLSVWDWQKSKKLCDAKVSVEGGYLTNQSGVFVSLFCCVVKLPS